MKSKKIIGVFLLLTSWASAYADDKTFKYEILNETEVSVSAASQDIEGDIVIPSTVSLDGKTYTVTSISKSAFFRCLKIKSAFIPKSVKQIGTEAFYYNENLEKIEVEEGSPYFRNIGLAVVDNKDYIVTYPGKGETDLVIPSSIKGLHNTAFEGCQSLRSIVIPQSVEYVGNMNFTFCLNLVKVEWNASASNVPASCFQGCSSLKEISFSESVTMIGRMAFYNAPLNTIIIKNPTPASIYSDTFDSSVFKSATVYVPKGSLTTYQSATGWKDFANLKETETIPGPQAETIWYLMTDTDMQIPMNKVGMLLATDDETHFSVLDQEGNILAENVQRITFREQSTTEITRIPITSDKGNVLKSFVDNRLILIGVYGNVNIYSASGLLIKTEKAQKGETIIDVSGLTPGTYILECEKISFKFNKK